MAEHKQIEVAYKGWGTPTGDGWYLHKNGSRDGITLGFVGKDTGATVTEVPRLVTFKKGDRVELIDGRTHNAKSGAIARVTQDYESGRDTYLVVEWDREVNDPVGNQKDGGYYAKNFKLAPKRVFQDGDKVTFWGTTVVREGGRWHYLDGRIAPVFNDDTAAHVMRTNPKAVYTPKPAVTFKDGDIFFEPHCVRVRKGEKWYFAHDGVESSVSDQTLIDNANAGYSHKVDQTAVKPLTYTGGEVVFQPGDVLMFRDTSNPLVRDRYSDVWTGWAGDEVHDERARDFVKRGHVLHRKDQLTLTLKPVQVEPKRAVFKDGDIVLMHISNVLMFRRDGQWGHLRAGSVSAFFSQDALIAAEIERGEAHLIDINAREKG